MLTQLEHTNAFVIGVAVSSTVLFLCAIAGCVYYGRYRKRQQIRLIEKRIMEGRYGDSASISDAGMPIPHQPPPEGFSSFLTSLPPPPPSPNNTKKKKSRGAGGSIFVSYADSYNSGFSVGNNSTNLANNNATYVGKDKRVGTAAARPHMEDMEPL